MSHVELAESSPTAPEAVSLISELNELLDGLYSPDDNHFALDPSEVEASRGVFLLARLDGEAVGCGAVRLLDGRRAEIKRMYVRPSAQGRGIGRAILRRLEAEARRRGAGMLVLEMGDSQPAAEALYRRAGFSPIPCWDDYLATPASVCLGKQL